MFINSPFCKLIKKLLVNHVNASLTPQTNVKELSLCHKFNFCNPYIFATWWCKSLIFQSYIIWSNSITYIKGLRHWVATILKLENQSLWQKLNSFNVRLKSHMFLIITVKMLPKKNRVSHTVREFKTRGAKKSQSRTAVM